MEYPVWLRALSRRHALERRIRNLREEKATLARAQASGIAVTTTIWTVVALVSAVFVGGYYSWRMRGFERARAMAWTGAVPGDLGEQFDAISRMAEEVRDEVRDTELGRDRLLELGRLAAETADSMRDIVWLLKTGNTGLYHVSEKMRETTLEVCGRSVGHFRVSGSFRPNPLPLMFVRRVYLIFREALGNAARHAKASTI